MNSIQQAADSADGFLIFDLGGLYDEFLSAFLAHAGWIQQEESLSYVSLTSGLVSQQILRKSGQNQSVFYRMK